MKEIGGYFGIEYTNIELNNFHTDAVRLNTARNCLAYILLNRDIKHIYIPYYVCDVVVHIIAKHNVSFSYYTINDKLEPETLPSINAGEAFLYVNYFGLKDAYVKVLATQMKGLIIDNSQALFARPLSNIDTFYSLRKFVGVSEGAFLYTTVQNKVTVNQSQAAADPRYLYKRIDVSARHGYEAFHNNEEILDELPLSYMSQSTEAFIKGYDFEKNKCIRERNFLMLHHYLGDINKFQVEVKDVNGPLCYPFLTGNEHVKSELLKNNVFVATYWPGMDIISGSFEAYIQSHLLPLPIDQRYSADDIQRIIDVIKKTTNDN